jgi:hypothetical protein
MPQTGPYIALAAGLLSALTAGLFILAAWRRQHTQALAAQQRQRQAADRAARGVWAGATIVTARSARLSGESGEHRVDLRLRVTPASGEPYDVQAAWRVEPAVLPQLQPGATVSIKLDPDDPRRVYPNLTGVELWPE